MSGQWAGKYFEWACPGCGDAKQSLMTPDDDDWLCHRCQCRQLRTQLVKEQSAAEQAGAELRLRIERLDREVASERDRAEMWREEFRKLMKGNAA